MRANPSKGFYDALIFLLLAMGSFVVGLAPLLAAERCLVLVSHLLALLVLVYAVLFVSLGLLVLAARWIIKSSGLPLVPRGLRLALVTEAAALSAIWYRLLNPFPLQPLIANQQYIPAAVLILVLLLAWLFFLFILRKIL